MTNALAMLPQEDILRAIQRHQAGDWGGVDDHDRAANDRVLLEGTRLLSIYQAASGVKSRIITEWDRSTLSSCRRIIDPHGLHLGDGGLF